MDLFTKLLFATIITFGMYACGETSKTTNIEGDTTSTKDTTISSGEEADQNTNETDNPETENTDIPNKDEVRNTAMEQRLLGSWGNKFSVSQFTFSEDNTFRQITPVPVINGTYKVIGDTLIIEGISTNEGMGEEKVNDKYIIKQIIDKKILKLEDLLNDGIHTLRYGEKPY
jgi:hypothetical protein